jgi:peptidoglycan hydrolase CwlO-like protein
VNRRTEDFRRRNPNVENLENKAKTELDEIRREQKEVADLLEQLTRPPGEMPDEKKDEEKKDDDKKEEKKERKKGDEK